MTRLVNALKAFWQALMGAELLPRAELEALKKELDALKARPVPKPVQVPERFEEGAVYTLLLLQREGRLIDFLQENLDAYADDQIGAAVRQIHKDCAKTLKEHFGIDAVLTKPEGEEVSVPVPLDPTIFKLTGNVPDAPPYKGAVRHKGWKAAKVSLPERTGKINATIIQPAEVEL